MIISLSILYMMKTIASLLQQSNIHPLKLLIVSKQVHVSNDVLLSAS